MFECHFPFCSMDVSLGLHVFMQMMSVLYMVRTDCH